MCAVYAPEEKTQIINPSCDKKQLEILSPNHCSLRSEQQNAEFYVLQNATLSKEMTKWITKTIYFPLDYELLQLFH